MKTKLIGFLICMLLIAATVSPVVGIINKEDNIIKKQTSIEPESQFDATSGDDEWPMYKHDPQRTGHSTSITPQTNNLLWTFNMGTHEAVASPAIASRKVYITSNNEVFYCFNAITGEKLWDYELPGGNPIGSPAVYEGKVYQGAVYDYVYCWNADTGELIWKHYEGYGWISSPAICDEKVYILRNINSQWGKLYCLNATTGEEIWSYDFGTIVQLSPAVYEGKVYIGSGYNNRCYCFNAENGNVIWDKDMGGYAFSSPAVVNGRIYIGGGNKLWCLNATIGEEIWSYDFGTIFFSSPSVAYGKVYINIPGGGIYCLDADTGELLWNRDEFGGEWIEFAIAVANEKIYTCSWTSGTLVCIYAENGTKLWEYPAGVPEWGCGFSSVAYGRVYVCEGFHGMIYCFQDPSSPPELPTIDGPTLGLVGEEYNFTVTAKDPEDHEVSYYIDWGDDTNSSWLGPHQSGEEIVVSHKWIEKGSYQIKAKAKDYFGDQSDWSQHTINIGPILDIRLIKGGLFKVKTEIKNKGADANGVNWKIALDGGAFIGKETTGTDDIPAGGEITVTSESILGLGPTTVTVTTEVPDGVSDTRKQNGFIYLFFVYIRPGDIN